MPYSPNALPMAAKYLETADWSACEVCAGVAAEMEA